MGQGQAEAMIDLAVWRLELNTGDQGWNRTSTFCV
jgi:hypothetical protein